MSEELIRYNHQRGDTDTWFVQRAADTVPVWAVNIEPYVEPVYTVDDWWDDLNGN